MHYWAFTGDYHQKCVKSQQKKKSPVQVIGCLVQQGVVLSDKLSPDKLGTWLLHHHFFGQLVSTKWKKTQQLNMTLKPNRLKKRNKTDPLVKLKPFVKPIQIKAQRVGLLSSIFLQEVTPYVLGS